MFVMKKFKIFTACVIALSLFAGGALLLNKDSAKKEVINNLKPAKQTVEKAEIEKPVELEKTTKAPEKVVGNIEKNTYKPVQKSFEKSEKPKTDFEYFLEYLKENGSISLKKATKEFIGFQDKMLKKGITINDSFFAFDLKVTVATNVVKQLIEKPYRKILDKDIEPAEKTRQILLKAGFDSEAVDKMIGKALDENVLKSPEKIFNNLKKGGNIDVPNQVDMEKIALEQEGLERNKLPLAFLTTLGIPPEEATLAKGCVSSFTWPEDDRAGMTFVVSDMSDKSLAKLKTMRDSYNMVVEEINNKTLSTKRFFDIKSSITNDEMTEMMSKRSVAIYVDGATIFNPKMLDALEQVLESNHLGTSRDDEGIQQTAKNILLTDRVYEEGKTGQQELTEEQTETLSKSAEGRISEAIGKIEQTEISL